MTAAPGRSPRCRRSSIHRDPSTPRCALRSGQAMLTTRRGLVVSADSTPVLEEQALERHPLLAKLDAEGRKLVLKSSALTRYRPGRLVIREGDAPRAFCLLEGAARVFHKQGEK